MATDQAGYRDRQTSSVSRRSETPSVDAPDLGRRRTLALGVGAAALLGAPALAQARARVAIIGGGVAGASLAMDLAQDPGLSVTLVNAERSHTTGSFSNLYLAGFRSLSSITFRYDRAAAAAGFQFVADRAVAVERESNEVRLASGSRVGYERLVLAPGVAFRDSEIVGYDVFARELMPHGYMGGYSSSLLKRRMAATPDGGVFAVTAPRAPFRGRLAPYERAAMIALALGRTKPRTKVLILDANADFPMRAAFEAAWAERYAGRIEWRGGAAGTIERVEASEMRLVMADGSRETVAGASVVPAQRAGAIALQAGVADEEGWAAVDPSTMRSVSDPAITVIGDAARFGAAPKSADIARAQAAIAAAALRADLGAAATPPAQPAAAEWAFVSHHAALKASGAFAVSGASVQSAGAALSGVDADPAALRQNALDANAWYAAMTAASFG